MLRQYRWNSYARKMRTMVMRLLFRCIGTCDLPKMAAALVSFVPPFQFCREQFVALHEEPILEDLADAWEEKYGGLE